MKSIVVATDLSARADRAIERALLLAQLHNAKLYVVHIVDDALPEAIAQHQADAAASNMRDHIASLGEKQAVQTSIEVGTGKRSVEIAQYARNIEAGLIILGIHDTGRESPFRGTTSEQLIRMGELPVLVVRDRATDNYKRVAVAIDFSVHSRRAIEMAVAFAPDAEIHLIHAYQVPFEGFLYGAESREQLEGDLKERMEAMIDKEMSVSLASLGIDKSKLHRVLKHGAIRQVIGREVERIKPDLLALGTHGRTGVANAILGSVAEDVLSRPPCDTLAVKAW